MESHFLTEALAILAAGAVIAYLCFRLGLVPIVGFLVAGVLIGPNALGLVHDRALVDAAAEVGVMFLLFTIGIEFSLAKLARIQRLIFGGGGLQVIGASLAMMAVLALFGVDWRAGLFTGFLVALSSTAIVLKLLADRVETSLPHGQVALGLLIFQDLAVIVMVLLVPMLAGNGGSLAAIAIALGKAGAIIALVLVFARRLMPAVLESVARTCSPELFLLTVIAICFGTAYLTNLAGVSLSLGAFLAGLVVSESRFSEHALGEILPLQILFSAVFFVSVGMLLDVGFLLTHLPQVLGAIALVLVVKVLTTALSVRALGYPLSVATAAGLMLAQVGEFSFVLERAGRQLDLFPAGLPGAGSQVFIASTVILMVATPLLTSLGVRFGRKVAEAQTEALDEPEAPLPSERAARENHVVVAGYGDAARRLVRVLHGSSIPYVITTLSPQGANEAEADGLPVLRGDASKQHTLVFAGTERAKMLVVADDEPAMARRIAAVARTVNPTMRILVRTRYLAEVDPLAEVGVDRVVAEELESVVQLFSDVMRGYNLSAEEIAAHEATIRGGGYAALRAPVAPAEPIVECRLGPDCLDRREIVLRDGAPATGQALAALRFDERFGLRLESLQRGGKALVASGDTMLAAGDVLVLAGSAAGFAQAAPLFRVGTLSDEDEAALDEREALRRIDTEKPVELRPATATCAHVAQIRTVMPSAPGCEDCLRSGDRWVHLRICMTCGHVGCCDSSPNKHATAHFHATEHPIIRSLEPGETWGWCYVDVKTL